MIPQPRPLIEVFSDIPDVRKSRGKRHPLSAILALSCCAMLCGSRSYSAIADWGRNYGSAIMHALGFTHNPTATLLKHTLQTQGFMSTSQAVSLVDGDHKIDILRGEF